MLQLKPDSRAKIHYLVEGSDFADCGVSGPVIHFVINPALVTCRNCKRNLRSFDGKWHFAIRWEYLPHSCKDLTEMGYCDCDPELVKLKTPKWEPV